MSKKLTPEQTRCIDIIIKHGRICRYEGGFWAEPDIKDSSKFYGGKIKSIGTQTVEALAKKNMIEPSRRATGKNGIFVIEYTLTI